MDPFRPRGYKLAFLITLLVFFNFFFKKAKAINESLTVRVVSLMCNAEGLKGKGSE